MAEISTGADRTAFLGHLMRELSGIEAEGLMKRERLITSLQSGRITVGRGAERRKLVVNLCANNYLGLADHPDLIAAAMQAMQDHG